MRTKIVAKVVSGGQTGATWMRPSSWTSPMEAGVRWAGGACVAVTPPRPLQPILL